MILRDRVEYASFLGVGWVVRRLPLRIAQWFGARVAGLAFWAAARQRGFTLQNLALAFPDLDERTRRQIGLESYRSFVWNLIDMMRGADWSRDEILGRVEISGIENLDRALKDENGVLLLTLHMGNFELAVRALNPSGRRLAVVGRPMRNPLLYALLRTGRTDFGGELIDRDNAAPRMLRVLRGNGVVGVLNDQYATHGRGVFVPFFGLRASTYPGDATLSLRTGAPVLPVFCVRDARDHHVLRILPPLEFEPSGDRRCDIERSTAIQNQVLEQIIRAHPEQWMWAHRRFRHSPGLPESESGSRV